ncbi:unnamed protein product [Brassica napus]|uniref:(rape) hypothetical protein n=1 Tax=Brassica napus TaxID=3708 RepID=A0A816KEA3_BRANA|nr:unnamed protein product [Brassica napus]
MQISKLKCKLNGEEEEEEENNAVMMESELSVKEEEVLLPGGKRVTRHCAGASYRSSSPTCHRRSRRKLHKPSIFSPPKLCHLRVWMETFQRRRSPTHPFPWESERRDGTDAGQYCWWRFSRSGYLGGDSGAAVPYESSGALVACRLRQWLSLLEGDGDAVGDSAIERRRRHGVLDLRPSTPALQVPDVGDLRRKNRRRDLDESGGHGAAAEDRARARRQSSTMEVGPRDSDMEKKRKRDSDLEMKDSKTKA